MNAQIIYDYQMDSTNGDPVYRDVPPPGPIWLTDLLGREYFVEVYSVAVDGPQVTDETIALIAKLPNIELVTFTDAKITDGGLVHFARMHNLEAVSLRSDQLTGAGLVHLRGLKRFKTLIVKGFATDAALEHISKLNDLEVLQIYGTAQITDKGLAQIAKLRNLQTLCLGSYRTGPVRPEDWMKVTDDGLANLYALKNLEFLKLNTTQVSQAGIDKLQKVLSNCKIEWNPKAPNDSR